MDDRALRKKEYEDLLNYCKADNRATPIYWARLWKYWKQENSQDIVGDFMTV